MSGGAHSGPSLPPNWGHPKLSEIARINAPLGRSVVEDEACVNFVPMRAVDAEGGGLLRPEVRKYGEVKKGYTTFLSGDVIMAKITPCMENGKTTVVPELPGSVCFGSTEFHVLCPQPGIEPRWIANFLLQAETRREARRAMTGAVGQMRVPASFLESVHIPLAPSQEQTRISDEIDELISDVSSAVAAMEEARVKLGLYRASALKAAVEGELTAEWRQQHPDAEPASELLKRISADPKQEGVQPSAGRPELPGGWHWTSLGASSEIQGGLQKSPARKPVKHHYPYLRVANVQRGSLDLSELSRFELTAEELERLRLLPGDLLIVEGNGTRSEIGRCAIWRGEVEDCVHQNHIIRVRPFPGAISEYVTTFLNSPAGQSAIQEVASSTSGLYTLSVSKIQKLTLPLPPTSEQEAIVEAVEDQLSVIDHLEAEIDAKLTAAQALRHSILRHAFTGQLVPQDPNDEPASELLKRIAAERAAAPIRKKTAKVP